MYEHERLAQEIEKLTSTQILYNELLYAVERKFDGESRHETALRYIREAEVRAKEPSGSSPCSPCSASDNPHT